MTKFLTQKEYGKHRGCSQQRVSALIKTGKIPQSCLKRISGRKLIDVDKADEALLENLDRLYNRESRHSKPPDKQIDQNSKKENRKKKVPSKQETIELTNQAGLDIVSLAEAQEIKANYDAALKKLEYEEKNGSLISKEIVDADFFAISRRFRDAVLNIPDRVGAELASITDVHTLIDRLRSEITATLEELSR